MKHLFNDPVWWSEKAVGTRARFLCMIAGQILGATAIWLSHGGLSFVVIFSVALPFYFIYALRQLVLQRAPVALAAFSQSVAAQPGAPADVPASRERG